MWESDYAKTIAELMKVFAEQNNVLYVDNAYTIKEIVEGITGKKNIPFKRAFGLTNRVRKLKVSDKADVYVLTPPVILTINFLPKGFIYNQLLKFNGWLIRRSTKRWLRKLNMTNELVNVNAFSPGLGIVNKRMLNEKTLIYHCYDEIGAATWLKKHGEWLEKAFMQIADATIVTSQGLYEKKKEFCRSCFLVKNAANIELFNKAYNPAISSKKTVGYIGSIDERLDYELLAYAAKQLPDVDFVFVGRIVDKQGEQLLSQYNNVKLVGAKKLEELPDYVKNFSLGIIPFAINEFNKGIYPLKINEYLAAGLPVVSTNFSYLDEFKNVISIADDKEMFQNFIVAELTNDSIEKKAIRMEVAKPNTWYHRVDQFSDIITSLEKNK
ncbi:glycosyltransferase [Ferruginibacter albus]|uniref:glycosyltransferase n=1 Tax=Ferruginibacter albus TaxID=2875540 RepID=UPI001CC64AB7|nr:glycosyltransferase [Ferruginibacter albus]UAY52936.1 glycosyltransferase [Ferruginibacter albus]